LQRVLDIKTKEEQLRKNELIRLTGELSHTRSLLLMQKRILEQIIEDLSREDPGERLSKQEFFLRHSAETDRQIEKLKTKAQELECRQREKIQELLKAKRFREGLEKLRAEAKTQFIKEQEKLEQKELDEASAIRFAREMMQKGEVGSPVN